MVRCRPKGVGLLLACSALYSNRVLILWPCFCVFIRYLEENVAALGVELTPQDMQELQAAFTPENVRGGAGRIGLGGAGRRAHWAWWRAQ